MKLKDLPWLPRPADDFRARVRALRQAETVGEAEIRTLSALALSQPQLELLAKAVSRTSLSAGTDWLKLSVLSNATVDLVLPAIVASAPRHGIWVDAKSAPFNSFISEALNPDSETHQRRNHVVVLALDYRAFDLAPCPGNAERADELVRTALQTVLQLVQAFQAANGAIVVVQTLAPPVHTLFGSLDAQLPGTQMWLVERFNALLRSTQAPGMVLLDVAHLAASVGLDAWHDPIQWNIGKFQYSHEMLPLYADALCRVVMAAKGKAKKCLVLDLDNTLWGGVIGDDGMTGIVLGQGDAVGEAYLAVQRTALALRARGIVLAVSSKNDEAVARQVFREHPEMLLREEHIAVFQANWKDKASNLRAIAETLNIDVSALVFLDDNPAERQQVRLALPEVGVPELPTAPEYYPAMLLAAGYFESVQFTAEDRVRAAQYQENAARTVALGAASDMGAYLQSLNMSAHVARFDEAGRARIAQLINKTNQFNLTTRRYSEAEVAALETDPTVLGLQVRLQDRFGDNGMISVLICKREADSVLIDTWLMSCRVLNRRLEEQVLNVLHAWAHAQGVRRLVGEYRLSPKNGMVKDHYRKLGFTLVDETEEGALWELDVAAYEPRSVPIALSAGADLEDVVHAVTEARTRAIIDDVGRELTGLHATSADTAPAITD
ncbi:HAD family hydrolase [Massilia sp. 9I]|uniref:HAD-IIIC family phosphatase n=1 Tax=Massilia sp. 9I TaxID=2653152 RepID=UPI0012F04A1D|nr:HAD-IIIC family phosphatase [Massilia sp. 9I]VXC21872.1 Haloacid dehalogenase [Massilia sp. 9I]